MKYGTKLNITRQHYSAVSVKSKSLRRIVWPSYTQNSSFLSVCLLILFGVVAAWAGNLIVGLILSYLGSLATICTGECTYSTLYTIKYAHRNIRLIESNTKGRYLKKFTCKGILPHVFFCLRPPPLLSFCSGW